MAKMKNEQGEGNHQNIFKRRAAMVDAAVEASVEGQDPNTVVNTPGKPGKGLEAASTANRDTTAYKPPKKKKKKEQSS